MPPIDLTQPFDPRDYSGVGVEGGVFDGLAADVSSQRPGAFALADVDEPPELLSSPRLRYPEVLRQAGLEGVAVVGFVVDTTGRADPATIKIVFTSDPGFDSAAQDLVRHSRYRPARVRGVPVRVLATLRIDFNFTTAQQR